MKILVLASLLAPLLAPPVASAGPATGGHGRGAGFCRDCPAEDCGDAAAKAARLRQRIAELSRSEEVIAQRADDAREQASRAYSGVVGPNGSAGRFSREYGGMADVRESLSSGRTDSLEDLMETLADVARVGEAATRLGEAAAPVRTEVTKTRERMTTAERYDAQAEDIRDARRRLEQELARLEQSCGAAAGSSGPPAGGPQGGPGSEPGGGGGGGGGRGGAGGGGGAAQGGPPQAPGVPPARDLDEILGYLVKLEPGSRRLADLAAKTRPLLEAIAASADAAADPQRRAEILAGAEAHLAAVRAEVDAADGLARGALAALSRGPR